jgi:hypothetical protein
VVTRLVVLVVAGWLVAAIRRGDGGLLAGSPTAGPAPSAALPLLVTQVGAGMLTVLAGWLAIAGLLGLAARAPGSVGRAATAVWSWLVPRAARATLTAALGIGVTAAPALGHVGVSAQTSEHVPQVLRPVTHGGWPSASHPAGSLPAMASAPPSTPAQADAAPQHRVTVQPGDSLWLIAARHLGPDAGNARVAAEWPRWYALNRETIGPDPNLLLSGTVLTAPTSLGGDR